MQELPPYISTRDPKTARRTAELRVYREIAAGIKARSDVIVCLTTDGTAYMAPEERVQVVRNVTQGDSAVFLEYS